MHMMCDCQAGVVSPPAQPLSSAGDLRLVRLDGFFGSPLIDLRILIVIGGAKLQGQAGVVRPHSSSGFSRAGINWPIWPERRLKRRRPNPTHPSDQPALRMSYYTKQLRILAISFRECDRLATALRNELSSKECRSVRRWRRWIFGDRNPFHLISAQDEGSSRLPRS
jgi:hypothetical protein